MLDEIAGGVLGDQAATHQSNAIAQFRATESPPMTALVNATVRCYYRDDRVMRSLGMEPRPPFPKGFDIPQGDWSLLDPVRARGRVYREL